MISEKIQSALNEQINAELASAYLYLGMASYFEQENLKGFARWMEKQAQEEWQHAKKIYDFIYERAGKVTLKGVEGPPPRWSSPLEAFESAYGHEQKVTGMIHKLVEMATGEKDWPTQVMLQWFVSEQVEEEDSALAIVEQLKMVGDSAPALLMLDAQLGQRE